jgi:hypothetical protein
MNRLEFAEQKRAAISPALELAVLSLWAAAIQMEKNFSRQEIEAVPGLTRAIENLRLLPASIGWEKELTKYSTVAP